MYRTRSLSLRGRDSSLELSNPQVNNTNKENEFKVPEILATPRKSCRPSKHPLKEIPNNTPLRPPLPTLKKSNTIYQHKDILPASPRTPRRSCRDQTIARIHECNLYGSNILSQKKKVPDLESKTRVVDLDESTESMTEESSETSETERCSNGDEVEIAVKHSKKNVSRRAKNVKKQPQKPQKSSRVLLNKLNASEDCLQGRENEFENIYDFIYNKLSDNIGGCIYIAGLPGTGKTATVHAVLKTITGDFKDIKVVLVNGMQVNEPKEVYLDIYNQLFPTKSSDIKMAINRLENEFGSRKKMKPVLTAPVILVIDELDLLCGSTKRQDVLYTIFDWGTRHNIASSTANTRASLIVLCIANTMDLPERLLHSRVSSRLGVSRLIFSPYTHQQLTNIILNCKLLTTFEQAGGDCVYCDPIAIALIARKVAAISGDARRALEITRRVSDKARANCTSGVPCVTMATVDEVIKEIFQGTPIVSIIRDCLSVKEKVFLKSVLSAIKSMKNSDETPLIEVKKVLRDFNAISNDLNWQPSIGEMYQICSSLAAQKLILLGSGSVADNIKSGTIFSSLGIYTRIRLNCSPSDLLFALGQQPT